MSTQTTMMKGAILDLALEHIEPRDEVRFESAWVGPAQAESKDTAWQPQAVDWGPTETPLLVMVRPDCAASVNTLLERGAAGQTVYAILPSGWTGEAARLVKCPRMLLRWVPEVPAAAAWSARAARLWFGAEVQRELVLGAPQGEALRQWFLRLFWHEATEEGAVESGRLVVRPAGVRPFEVPEPSQREPLRLVSAAARLEPATADSLVHRCGGDVPRGKMRRLWIAPSATHHERLSELVRAEAEVLWSARDLPDLLVEGGKGRMLLPGDGRRVEIDLDAAQVAVASRLLEAPGDWQFRCDVRLGDHRGGRALWLSGASAGVVPSAEQRITLADIGATSLRAMPTSSPAKWPAAEATALAARYQWKVLAPRVPAGASEDGLVAAWRRVDDTWATRAGRVKGALVDLEQRVAKLETRDASGFARALAVLGKDLERLTARPPSRTSNFDAGPMAQLEAACEALGVDVSKHEHAVREETARGLAAQAWQTAKTRAEQRLPTCRAELVTAEAECVQLEALLSELDAQMTSGDKAARKDAKAQFHHATDKRKKAKERVAKLKHESEELLATLGSSFEHTPAPFVSPAAMPGKGRFVPVVPVASGEGRLDVPEDALPEVGALQVAGKKRYLVIERWEELEAGEAAAARLDAALVTSRGGSK